VIHNGTTTSIEAARSIAPETAQRQRDRILDYIASRPDGATDEEGQFATGIAGNTYRPRRGELERDGKIEKTLQTRRTASNRRAAVWRATR
jgi:hypothetical protein